MPYLFNTSINSSIHIEFSNSNSSIPQTILLPLLSLLIGQRTQCLTCLTPESIFLPLLGFLIGMHNLLLTIFNP